MPETTHAHLQGRSLCLELVSPTRSKCVWLGLRSGDKEGQGRILDVVVGEELCDVACCMGSGIVVWKDSAIQRFMHEMKQNKSGSFCACVNTIDTIHAVIT